METSLALLPLIFLLCLLSAAQTFPKAAGMIINSNNPASLTILAPSDAAGNPSLEFLGLYLLPVGLPLPTTLKSLPFGAKIPTLLHGGDSLTVTSAVSLDNVTVEGDPLHDDGSLIIYRINMLFSRDKLFSLASSPAPPKNPSADDVDDVDDTDDADDTDDVDYTDDLNDNAPYREAIGVLRSKGWSTMASFLKMQLYWSKITVFAPVDEVFSVSEDPTKWDSLLFRHVVSDVISYSDLSSLDDGSALQTYLPGYNIIVSRNGGVTEVNGVPVTWPEIYKDDWIVVHGIREVLQLPQSV